jgi:hypothetical protein
MRCKGTAELREERRVAVQTSDEQRSSTPDRAAKMAIFFRKSPKTIKKGM